MTQRCGGGEPGVDSTRYTRLCDYLGTEFGSVGCIRGNRQEPCPEYDVLPVAQR